MKNTRNTTAKTAVIEIFSKSKTAMSHSEIYKITQGLCDRVTVYRILDRLVQEDIVHKIVDLDGIVKYAKCNHHPQRVHSHNHAHFSCENCHEVTCLEDVKPSYIIPHNYKVNDINFMLSGLCLNCLNSNI